MWKYRFLLENRIAMVIDKEGNPKFSRWGDYFKNSVVQQEYNQQFPKDASTKHDLKNQWFIGSYGGLDFDYLAKFREQAEKERKEKLEWEKKMKLEKLKKEGKSVAELEKTTPSESEENADFDCKPIGVGYTTPDSKKKVGGFGKNKKILSDEEIEEMDFVWVRIGQEVRPRCHA